jgi:hypothetical protein
MPRTRPGLEFDEADHIEKPSMFGKIGVTGGFLRFDQRLSSCTLSHFVRFDRLRAGNPFTAANHRLASSFLDPQNVNNVITLYSSRYSTPAACPTCLKYQRLCIEL